jgi:hypothetical protein
MQINMSRYIPTVVGMFRIVILSYTLDFHASVI